MSVVKNASTWEVFAVRYATRAALRRDNFIGGDPHEAPMPLDYYVWLIRNGERAIVIDMGFTAAVAKKRKRDYLRTPAEGLALLSVQAADVEDVIVTHLHYDHVGTYQDFPKARFHLQDDEMAYATGRYMRFSRFNHGYEVDDVVAMVHLTYKNRVQFHAGEGEIAPGVSVHRIGGHTRGLQCVRVSTARGWVVLASDASHFYEHMEQNRCFPTVFNVGEMMDGYEILRRLADSEAHIIPGHDPLVMQRYPAVSKELEGIAVRLDVAPRA
ncbi:MAG: N-acyl homoserine lactonase family protein [Burkholderiales bacterium]